jgi:L-seryl-tRNA(Ser) seleniumtransferase
LEDPPLSRRVCLNLRKDNNLPDFYQKLSVKRVINAAGALTRLGGMPMADEVLEAMRDAAQWSVRIDELQEKAGAYLAEVTGAEAGYVTCGAAAGLQLAAAACLAGQDIRKMELLPDTSNIPNEIVIQRIHRNAYDHALRAAGASLVEVGHIGNPARGYTRAWHIEAAIHKNTVAVQWVYMNAPDAVSLEETVAAAHKHGVPVIVDAAAALPPATNLRRLVATGADLVSFSGGKAIGGPQASGILVGRRDLIDSVALQHQDMDVLPLTWTMRHRFLDSGKLPGPPLQGIGRPLKVGKEQVAGLLTALKIFVGQDHSAVRNEQIRRIKVLQEGLADVSNLKAELMGLEGEGYPLLRLILDEQALGLTAFDFVNRLFDDDPAIAVGQDGAANGYVTLNPFSLDDDKLSLIVRRIRAILGG